MRWTLLFVALAACGKKDPTVLCADGTGPTIDYDEILGNPGSPATVRGTGLDTVTAVVFQDDVGAYTVRAEPTEATATSMTLDVPFDAQPGTARLMTADCYSPITFLRPDTGAP